MSGGGSGAFALNGNLGFDTALSDVVQEPEPGTLTLVGSALAGLAFIRRRRKANA